jgi:polysaccharide export outer membrane protein
MRLCRFLMVLLAAAALAACARSPARQSMAMPQDVQASASRADLDTLMYGAPAPRRYPQTAAYQPLAPAYRPPPPSYRPPPNYPPPGYAPPGYRPAYAPPPGYAPPPAPSYQPPPAAYHPAPPPSYPVRYADKYVPVKQMPIDDGPYTLDSGDKLRIVVFGQDTLSNTYAVDAAGMISMPLIGTVPARDQTTAGLAASIKSRLAQGYIREPSVAVEVDIYRPFFVLGEVTYPGQYPFVPHMTVENAVSIAGGFTPRATKSTVTVTRKIGGVPQRFSLPLRYPIRPGDVVTVGERWF